MSPARRESSVGHKAGLMASYSQTAHTNSFKHAKLTTSSMSRQKSKAIKAPDWADLIELEMKETQKLPQGNGWKTVQELKGEHGIGERKLYQLINTLIAAGECERFYGHTVNNAGARSSKVWYRLKKRSA